MLSDRLMETLGGRAWSRRQAAKAMRRLRLILEEDRDRGRRASIAAELSMRGPPVEFRAV